MSRALVVATAAGLWFTSCLGFVSPTDTDWSTVVEGGARDAAVVGDGGGVGTGGGSAGTGGSTGTGGGGSADSGVHDSRIDGGPLAHEDAGSSVIPMFVAQGHLGRTTISCDLGRSWAADQSDVGPLDRCWTTPPEGGVQYECDHQPTAGRGIAFGGGGWVANFGWGPVGTVRRSPDGVHWERVDAGQNFASMAYSGGGFFAADGYPRRSEDLGLTWKGAGVIPDVWTNLSNVRRGSAGELNGLVFVVSADNGLGVGRPSGADVHWTLPTVPTTCRAPMTQGGVVVAQGRVLLVSGEGVACSSVDGSTFQTSAMGGPVTSHLVFDGTHFRAWGRTTSGTAVAFQSTDGVSWTTTPTKRQGASGSPDIGPVAFGAGVFVAATGGWGAWYQSQRFYRSTDGVTWEELPTAAFTPSHPIINIAFGAGRISAQCMP